MSADLAHLAADRDEIDNAWAQGNPEIIDALAGHRLLRVKSRSPK